MSKSILVINNYALGLVGFRLPILLALKEKGLHVYASSPYDTKVVKELEKYNIDFIPLFLQRAGLSIFDDIKTFFAIKKIIRQIRPDYVLCYTAKPVIYGGIAALFTKVPSYGVITGLGSAFISSNFRAKLIRFIIRNLYRVGCIGQNRVFFQNDDDLNYFIFHKILSAHKALRVNGSGVDLDYYNVKNLPSNLTFLLIARIIEEKGINEYLAAAKIIRTKYPQVRFLLVGATGDDNPSAISLSSLTKQLQKAGVEYLGSLADVRPAIEATSVYVLPSYREGTPRSVLEAMAMGRPIITTNVPGCRETVQHGLNGYLVPAKNIMKLVESMEQFILTPNIAINMGRASRNIAETKFDVHKVNQIILKAMEII